jgi:neurofibromin 1
MTSAGARINRDIDHTSLKVLSQITNGLALHVAGTGSTDTVNQSQPAATARSRLFFRIYTCLVKVLERSASGSDEADPSLHRPGSDSRRNMGASPVADTAALAITALSNLLSSNVDVGLKHCMAMGYHAKAEIRTAFMQVMTRALRNGAPIAGTTSSAAANANKRRSALGRPFIDALNVGNMALAVACVEVCPVGPEVDEMSTLLFRVMEAKGLLLPFLRVLVEREVAMTSRSRQDRL